MIRRLIEWIKGCFLPDYDCLDGESPDAGESGTLMNYIRPGEKLDNPYSESNRNNDKSGLTTKIEN